MSSMLLTFKILRNFSSLSRRTLLPPSVILQDRFLEKLSTKCTLDSRRFHSTKISSPKNGFDSFLEWLSHLKRNSLRLSNRSTDRLLTEVRLQRQLSRKQALVILESCSCLSLADSKQQRQAVIEELWTKVGSLKVQLDTTHYNVLLSAYIENDVELSVAEVLSEMAEKRIPASRKTFEKSILIYCKRGDVENAEKLVAEMEKHGIQPDESIYNALVLGFGKAGNAKRSEEIISEMLTAGIQPAAETFISLMSGYATVGDLSAIQKVLERCEREKVSILDESLLKVVYELATTGHGDQIDDLLNKLDNSKVSNRLTVDTIYRLVNQKQEMAAFKIWSRILNGKESESTALFSILDSLAEGQKLDEIEKIWEEVVEAKQMPVNSAVAGALIKVHLVRSDLLAAVQVFEEMCEKYRITPGSHELTVQLIRLKHLDGLQRVTDAIAGVHGQTNAKVNLAFAFLDIGKLREVQEILKSAPNCSTSKAFDWKCEKLVQKSLVKQLEDLLEVTRNIRHVDRNVICTHLLACYVKTNSVTKATELFERIQDDNVELKAEFLQSYAKLLKANGMKGSSLTRRPIDSTEAFSKSVADESFNVDRDSRHILNICDANRLDEATEAVVAMAQRNLYLLPSVFKVLIRKLAANGDSKNLERLRENLSDTMRHRLRFNNSYCVGLVQAGQAKILLKQLEEAIDSAKNYDQVENVAKNFPSVGIFTLLASHPELIEEYESIAKKYEQKDIHAAIWALWQHHFTSGNDAACQRLWDEILVNHRTRKFEFILQEARGKLNDTLIVKLIDLLKTTEISSKALGLAYSTLIYVHSAKEDYQKAMQIIDEAIAQVTLDNLHPPILQKVKTAWESTGGEFPHEILKRERQRRGPVDSLSRRIRAELEE